MLEDRFVDAFDMKDGARLDIVDGARLACDWEAEGGNGGSGAAVREEPLEEKTLERSVAESLILC